MIDSASLSLLTVPFRTLLWLNLPDNLVKVKTPINIAAGWYFQPPRSQTQFISAALRIFSDLSARANIIFPFLRENSSGSTPPSGFGESFPTTHSEVTLDSVSVFAVAGLNMLIFRTREKPLGVPGSGYQSSASGNIDGEYARHFLPLRLNRIWSGRNAKSNFAVNIRRTRHMCKQTRAPGFLRICKTLRSAERCGSGQLRRFKTFLNYRSGSWLDSRHN